MTEKRYRYHKNKKWKVDQDYTHKLNEEELSYLNQFNDEYYGNTLNKPDSIHRQALTEEEFSKAKKETYNQTNCENRDLYGISATSSNYLKFLDDDAEMLQIASTRMNKLQDPKYAFDVFLEETIDEILNDYRDVREILLEYGEEMVKLGATLRDYKINLSIKKGENK